MFHYLSFLLAFHVILNTNAFSTQHAPFLQKSQSLSSLNQHQRPPRSSTKLYELNTIKYYEHDGWKLAYRFKKGNGLMAKPAIILIHPVGIGLSSWFYNKLIYAWDGGEDLYAPDLIGCGLYGDRWDPTKRGLFFPLDWVKGIETLIQSIERDCIVVAQGGLAPVGVQIAYRNRSGRVKGLVLASPPQWKVMTTSVPAKELERNYSMLQSKMLGNLGFSLLEQEGSVRFFSDSFLFNRKTDDMFVELASVEAKEAGLRPPVQAFNAGLCNHRSFEEELKGLEVPTLILSGESDNRASGRRQYATEMRDCQLMSVKGKNVLPWESPEKVGEVIDAFSKNVTSTKQTSLKWLSG